MFSGDVQGPVGRHTSTDCTVTVVVQHGGGGGAPNQIARRKQNKQTVAKADSTAQHLHHITTNPTSTPHTSPATALGFILPDHDRRISDLFCPVPASLRPPIPRGALPRPTQWRASISISTMRSSIT